MNGPAGAMGPYARFLQRIGHAPWFAAVARRVGPPVDRALYRLSKGRVLSTGPPVLPTLLLTTTGSKTRKPRTVPLLYVPDGQRFIVAGSNWGQRHHPAWSTNLLADPRARVQIGPDHVECLARAASSEERERLWPKLDRIWPAYDTYRRRSGRELRVFILEPATLPT
jgi:F420H(2)-dependent quinone reductase